MKHFQPDRPMNKFFIVLIFVFQCNFLSAQVVSIQSVEICAGQEVLLPVYGESLVNVGALTIYIGFDTVHLTFLNVENIDSQLDGMSVNLMSAPTQIAFAWSSTTPVQFSNSKLFDLKFLSNGQSALVQYNSGCELSDTGGIVLPVTYINGEVHSGVPVIFTCSGDTTVIEGGTAIFSVESANTSSYLWRESTDNGVSWVALDDNELYSGSHSKSLSISGVPINFNNNLYQCVLYNGLCQTLTNPSLLQVDEFAVVSEISSKYCCDFFVSPVPIYNFCNVEFTLKMQSDAQIRVFDQFGQIVENIISPSLTEGYHYIKLNASDWHSGVYYVHMILSFQGDKCRYVKEIVRK